MEPEEGRFSRRKKKEFWRKLKKTHILLLKTKCIADHVKHE